MSDCPGQSLVDEVSFRAVLCCLYFAIFIFGIVGNLLVVAVRNRSAVPVVVSVAAVAAVVAVVTDTGAAVVATLVAVADVTAVAAAAASCLQLAKIFSML